MRTTQLAKTLAITLGMTVVMGVPAFAKKPDSPGNKGSQGASQSNSASSPEHQESKGSQTYFDNARRDRIREYYATAHKAGDCPPGLAKKQNGCQPPGQIKKWRKGEPLPPDLTYYEVPDALIAALGPAPDGEKIVQVDMDLLLINIATGLVIDAFDVQE